MKVIKVMLMAVVLGCLAFSFPQRGAAFVVTDYDMDFAGDAVAGNHYGFSVDTDGRWLVVGAKYATIDGLQSGSVYVYRRTKAKAGWEFFQKLVPENESEISPAEFGESVAVLHNRILVGARSMLNSSGQQSGAAYLYSYRGRKRGWELETRVEPSDGQDDDEFGRSVALGPNRLFIGARFASNSRNESSGAVYVFRKRSADWDIEAKLTDPQGGEGDQFGRAISFDNKRYRYLVVGSRKASDGVGDQGKVVIFKKSRGEWAWSQSLEAHDGTETDYYGQSVVLSGDLLVVGARDSLNNAGDAVGAAYIYRLDEGQQQWQIEQKLMPEDGHNKGQYGFDVDLDRRTGTSLAVSARRMNSALEKKTGQVYLYSYDESTATWLIDDIVAPDNLKPDDEFGQCLAMDPVGGAWLVVGADQVMHDGKENAGAIYTLKSEE